MQRFFLDNICVAIFMLAFVQFAPAEKENDACVMERTGLAGTCLLLQDCPSVIDDVVKDSLSPTVCGFQDKLQIVCCPNVPTEKPMRPPPTRISEKKCIEYQDAVFERISISVGLGQNPIEKKILRCAISYVPLIVGGEAANAKEFPHMALIGYNDANELKWMCGGTLISEQFVLTAAHCLYDRLSGYAKVVRLGDLILNSTTDDAQPIDVKIIERFQHEEYKIPAKYNDIALLKLEHPVTFSQYVRPACLAETFEIPGAKVIATGWGQTDYDEKTTSDFLQKVSLDLIPHPVCNASNAHSFGRKLIKGIVDATQVCAGSKQGKDTCQGDSGGPIQIHHSVECMYAVVGITSFGIRCAELDSPGIYTRVYPYIDWIEKIVWPQ